MTPSPPAPPVRVLVVDDAVVVRRLVTDALQASPCIDVVGTAANGLIALQKIPQVSPDVVTLDIEMPGMNGIETLKHIRERFPHLPVIMFSTLTERGAVATLEALAAGASDYVTKPANVGSVAVAQQRVRDELVPRIVSLARRSDGVKRAPAAQRTATQAASTRGGGVVVAGRWASPTRPGIVAIGVSTGGPNALAEVIPALPGTLAVPVVVVQHMPQMFTRLLAERLNAQSPLTVCEAVHGQVLRPGMVALAPGDFHMVVVKRGPDVVVHLNQEVHENSCRPAVDPLFRSVASVYGARALAVVLTGMGQDGLRGAEDVRRAGGRVVAQDEATSVVWGMPGFVVRAQLADAVVPLHDVAHLIEHQVMTSTAGTPSTGAAALVR